MRVVLHAWTSADMEKDPSSGFICLTCCRPCGNANTQALQDAVQEELLLAQGQAEQERAAAQAQQQVNDTQLV